MAIDMLWGTCLRVFGSRALDLYMFLFPPAVSAVACSSCPIGCLSLRGSEPFNNRLGKMYKDRFWGSNSAFSDRFANSFTLQGNTLTHTRFADWSWTWDWVLGGCHPQPGLNWEALLGNCLSTGSVSQMNH